MAFDAIFVDKIAEAASTPADQVRVLVIFALLNPLGWFIHYCVHGREVRLLFVTVMGVFIQLVLFKAGIMEIALMGYGAYILMVIF